MKYMFFLLSLLLVTDVTGQRLEQLSTYTTHGNRDAFAMGMILSPTPAESGPIFGFELGTNGFAGERRLDFALRGPAIIYLTGGYQFAIDKNKHATSVLLLVGWRRFDYEHWAGYEWDKIAGLMAIHTVKPFFAGLKFADPWRANLVLGARIPLNK